MNNKQTIDHRSYWVDRYKVSNGCSVCGYNKHPSALCFDHLPEYEKSEAVKNGYSKKSCAGGMYRLYYKTHSYQDLIEEIKKCRLVCSNCHMEHTHNKKRLENKIDILSIEELTERLRDNGY